jgi:polysaccharide chain length determinant protein (PEP-CTERM system associated)
MLGHRPLNAEDYLSILKRRWWLIAIPMAILPILAIAATFFIPPQYESQTLVLIDQQKVPDDYVKSVVSEDIDGRLASMKEQILSRSSLQPIIEHYNLYSTEHLSMDGRIDLARKSVVIKTIHSETHSDGLPGFFISFMASDPHTAQQVCEEITSLFTGANLRSREAAAEGTTEFLKEQLETAKRNLDDQDAKLATFQSHYYGMLPSDEGNNNNILTTLNTQLEATTQALSNMEVQKSFSQTMLDQQAPPTSPSAPAVQTPQVQQTELDKLLTEEADLTAHYTSDYPEVKAVRRKIADLRKQMATPAPAATASAATATPSKSDSAATQNLRNQIHAQDMLIQAKRAEQAELTQKIRMYQSRIQSTPQVDAEFKQLTRDNQTAQTFYNGLLTKMEQSKMATDLEHRQQGEQFHVMDEANLPDSPTFPKRSVFAVGGLVAGVCLGLLIVGLLEYKDTALRSERDVWAFTQLPTLAVIAWSGDVAQIKLSKRARLKRLFSRKEPKDLLADAPG